MVVGIGLRQFERLAPLAVLIHVGKERTGEGAIVAATAEHQPATIARPCVIALRIVAVHLLQGFRLACGQIHRP